MRTLWLMSILTGLISTQLNGQLLVVPDTQVEVEDSYLFLDDPESKYQSPQDLRLEDFTAVSETSFNTETKSYWLQFSIHNPQPNDRNIVLDFQNWSYVDFYARTDSDYKLKKTGHLLPYSERDYAMANKSYIQLNISGRDTVHCLVRIESRYNNEMIPTSLGFSMAPEELVAKENHAGSRIIFFFLGIFSVIFIYNFFLALSTKMKSYWFYLLVVIFAFYHTAYNSGYLIPIMYAWKGFPVALTYFETISSALFSIVVLLFASEFLKTADRYPRLNKFINWTIILFIATGIISFISLEIGVLLTLLGSLMVVVLVIVAGIRSVRDKYPASRFFLIGFSAFMAGALITVLAVAGVIPMTRFTFNYALPLGTAIEVSLYSLALANLINVLRRENEKNQARIIEQLEENQQLQTKVNRELEQKVQERTKQIIEQKDLISAQKDEISQEKEKSDKLLTNILPDSVAEELKEHGKANPKYFETASVLFADFKEFTKISPQYTPDALVERLDFFFKAFDDIITKHNLEKIKTIGDSYMAVGGVPVLDENHAKNACSAALEIIEFIDKWNKQIVSEDGTPWEIRAGINSGPLIAGVVGKKKFSFDVWGDSVNIASRMESNGIPGKLNISTSTFEFVKNDFICNHRGKAEIKGKGMLDMYTVESAVSQSAPLTE